MNLSVWNFFYVWSNFCTQQFNDAVISIVNPVANTSKMTQTVNTVSDNVYKHRWTD